MRRIGMTGTIASGKTSAAILLKRHGYTVFNSDQYAKLARHAGNPCFARLIEVLGREVAADNGDIDPKKMAARIFSDEQARLQVNAIVHPYVREGMEKFFQARKEEPFAFAEVPLLFEAHMEDAFDEICVITCDKDIAVKRMMEDREYTEEEALNRYNSQIDPQIQIEKADKVIYNNGTLSELNSEVNRWLRELKERTR